MCARRPRSRRRTRSPRRRPKHRQGDDAERGVLVDIDRVDVHDDDRRHEDGRTNQRDRERADHDEREQRDQAAQERDPECLQIGLGKLRQEGREERHAPGRLARSCGKKPAAAVAPRASVTQVLAAAHAERDIGDSLSAARTVDLGFTHGCAIRRLGLPRCPNTSRGSRPRQGASEGRPLNTGWRWPGASRRYRVRAPRSPGSRRD